MKKRIFIIFILAILSACSGGNGSGGETAAGSNPPNSILGQLIPDAQAQQGPIDSTNLVGRWKGIIYFGDTTHEFEINLNGDGSYLCTKTQNSSCFLCNSSDPIKTVDGTWKIPTKRSVAFIPTNRAQALAYWNHPVTFFEAGYLESLTTCNGWMVPMTLTKNQ